MLTKLAPDVLKTWAADFRVDITGLRRKSHIVDALIRYVSSGLVDIILEPLTPCWLYYR